MAGKRPAFAGQFPAPPIRERRQAGPMDDIIGGPEVPHSAGNQGNEQGVERQAASPSSEGPRRPLGRTNAAHLAKPSPRREEANRETGQDEGKVVQTFRVDAQVLDGLKDAVWWNRTTLTAVANKALTEKLRELEEQHGGPFPKRPDQKLKPGRPSK